jgi:hypothetical protein
MIAHMRPVTEELDGIDKRIQGGLVWGDRIGQDEAAAGSQDACDLLHRLLRIRVVVSAVARRDQVEARPGEREIRDIGANENEVSDLAAGSEPRGFSEHLRGQVNADDAADQGGQRESGVADRSAQVERFFTALDPGRLDQDRQVRAARVDRTGQVVLGDCSELSLDLVFDGCPPRVPSGIGLGPSSTYDARLARRAPSLPCRLPAV